MSGYVVHSMGGRPQDTADSGRTEAERTQMGKCEPPHTLYMFCMRVVRQAPEISIGIGGVKLTVN